MKKFLVILMVVAMASFIFVGCLPTTNTAPVFTSTAGTTATVGTAYSYTPTATDPEGDAVTFTVAGITDMTISAGVITWTPTTIGTYTFVVTASDGTDGTAQTNTITVSEVVVPDAVAIAAVNAALTPAELNAALDNAAFTGYTAANYTYYLVASFSTTSTDTVVKIDAAIAALNVVAAEAAVLRYVALKVDTDATIVIAAASLAGAKEGATEAVAALPAGTVQTAKLARIVVKDAAITTAATITSVTVGSVNILAAVDSIVAVVAEAKNTDNVVLTTDVAYAWSVTVAHEGGNDGDYTATIKDIVFSDKTTKATVITKALLSDAGDSYTIKVVATKGNVEETTATVIVI